MSTLLDGVLVSRNLRSNVLSRSKAIYLRNIGWNVASVKQIYHSSMFDGGHDMKYVRKHEDNMLYKVFDILYTVQKKADLMDAGYAMTW